MRKFLIGLGIFLGLFVIVGFFLPEHVHLSRTKVIKAQPAVIFEQVNELHNWEKWSPWHGQDPNMQIIYSTPSSGPGAWYSWKSEKMGNGKLNILNTSNDETINYAIDFGEHGMATGAFYYKPNGEGTEVTWTMDTDLGGNPLMRYFGLLYDSMIGSDYEKGLDNLKKVVEKS